MVNLLVVFTSCDVFVIYQLWFHIHTCIHKIDHLVNNNSVTSRTKCGETHKQIQKPGETWNQQNALKRLNTLGVLFFIYFFFFWRGVRPEVWNFNPFLRIFLPQNMADLTGFFSHRNFCISGSILRVFLPQNRRLIWFNFFFQVWWNGTIF